MLSYSPEVIRATFTDATRYHHHMRHYLVPDNETTEHLRLLHTERRGGEAADQTLAHYWYRLLYGYRGTPGWLTEQTIGPEDVVRPREDSSPPPPVRPPDDFRRLQGQLRSGNATRQGQLRIGDTFFDDIGPVNPVCCHAGDLFALYTRDPGWATAEAEDIAAAGYQGVRVWPWLAGPYWERLDRVVTPPLWTRMPAFCEMLQRVGLRLMCSMGDITRQSVPSAWPGYMREMAGILKPFAPLTISIDAGNEAWNQTSIRVEDLSVALQAFTRVYSVHVRSLTDSPEGDLRRWDGPPATVNDVHPYRGGHIPDKIRHVFSNSWEGDPAHRLGVLSEPWGPGPLVSVTENSREIDRESIGLLTAQSLIFGWAFVYFSSPGVSVRNPGEFKDQVGFTIPPKIAMALPSDVMTWRTWAHGGDTQTGRRAFVADTFHNGLRCDHAFGPDGKVAIVCYGTRGRRTEQIEVERGVAGRWLDCERGTFGPDVTARAGGRVALPDCRHGAVFVGGLI